jgi:hypothetical protein
MFHPHTTLPTVKGESCLIAVIDPCDGMPFLLDGIHIWNGECIVRDEDNQPISDTEYWWLSERELLALLLSPVLPGAQS